MAEYVEDLKVGSPLWWLHLLSDRLQARQANMSLYDRYYRGEHALPFLTESHKAKMNDEFSALLRDSKMNFCRLVVDATEERLGVEGFRLSSQSDQRADQDSWNTWQANDMDEQSQTAFLESLIKGTAYVSVWSDRDKDGYADICVEDPMQTIVAYDSGSNYRRRVAALKIWLDENTGQRRSNVYLPSGIFKFVGPGEGPPTRDQTPEQKSRVMWAHMPDGFVRNLLPGVIPIVPLRNRPRLLVEGESELSDVISPQNQINGFVFLLALGGYFGAHRQRWAAGITITEDADGRPVEPFNIAVDRLVQTENPEAKFGDFAATDLSGYLKAIDQKVQHIAVTTRTPRHYLFQEGQSPSGDAIQSAESGLVKKVTRKQRPFGEGLEEVMRLARRFEGKSDAAPDSEIVWADPQTHSPATLVDATIKKYLSQLIPRDRALADLGYSQAQIAAILAAPKELFAPDAVVQNAIAPAQKRDITGNTPAGA